MCSNDFQNVKMSYIISTTVELSIRTESHKSKMIFIQNAKIKGDTLQSHLIN